MKQHTASAASVAPRHFRAKVYMSWSIHQMQQIVFSLVVVQHATCLRLDRDPSFSLHVQFVQNLLVTSRLDRASELQQPVTERTLAMINMSYDTEVAESLDGDSGDSHLKFRRGLLDVTLRGRLELSQAMERFVWGEGSKGMTSCPARVTEGLCESKALSHESVVDVASMHLMELPKSSRGRTASPGDAQMAVSKRKPKYNTYDTYIAGQAGHIPRLKTLHWFHCPNVRYCKAHLNEPSALRIN